VKNFKTFKDEIIFSMIPAQKIKDIEYSVLKSGEIAKKAYKALSSAVIYGPNAAGKTNIISAMEVLKNIILSGSIKNDNNTSGTPNEAVRRLELIPNSKSLDSDPVEFGIRFIEHNCLFEYELKLDIGKFLNDKYDRKILDEKLSVNSRMIFNRCDTVEIGNLDIIKKYLINDFDHSTSEKMAKSNLDAKELFLSSMFRSVISKKLVDIITSWFRKKFICIYQSNRVSLRILGIDEKINSIKNIDNDTYEAIKQFGVTTNDICYISPKDGAEALPHSMVQINNEEFKAIPIEFYESYGTERFLSIFPLILVALDTGSTLIIDEFDASIHPMALMSIVGAFHNNEININNAQLIFNTHNPIFLNKNLFRRDEIKFVERDDETGHSNHYSLSDFKTSGLHGVRKTDDYMKNYFINQYGAIRNIDFSDILKDNLQKEEV